MNDRNIVNPLRLPAGISPDFLRYHRICPLEDAPSGELLVAIADGTITSGIDDLGIAYGRSVRTIVVSSDELMQGIERLSTDKYETIELSGAVDAEEEIAADVRDLASQPPVVRYVNMLIRDAYEAMASDIHLEAVRDGLVTRVRLDGVLSASTEPPPHLHHAVVSRIKLLAELDIAERRRPQDGRIRVRLEQKELDLRVSTVPTMHGESVVLRLLDHGGRRVGLEELGMSPDILARFTGLVERQHGMLLVTGPTGSGKTTTLYAALQCRKPLFEKIITVEDPVEYEIASITQVPVHRGAGVTFATALRAILRQDPDVVMVGEMRDGETAEIAVQAAMTGHLLLSTLHTNDAVGTIARLSDLGIPDYLIVATLEGVLAQRLVRRICEACRVNYEPNPESVATIVGQPVGRVKLTRGIGCSSCRGTGFRGRVGIYELLTMSDEVRDAIARQMPRVQLRALAVDLGMIPLLADGWAKVRSGLTTVEEVLRVAQI
jgi:general secretion pathway protein E